MNKKQILCTGLSLALLLSSAVSTPASVAAGKYFTIQYTHSKKKVKKKAINARYNNKIISTKIPGYIEGSTSMYSAYWIFGRCSSLGTKYSYSSSKKRVTLQRNSQKLVMTLNSRTATLNGKKFTLPSAPRKIRYVAKKKNYIMVPGDSVAKKLGLNYSWNNRLLSGVLSKGSTTTTTAPTPSAPSNTTPQPSNPSGSTTKITASESDYSIRIKKPDGLSSSSISSNDDYWNKQLQIIIDGDYRSFFNTASNRTIKDSLTYKVSYSNGKTYINLGTSTIKGFSVTQTDSYIYVKYAAPKDMFSRVIVIDAGHGGKDSGATGNGYLEKNMTLKIVQNIKANFDSNPLYKVYYTRLSDWYPSLTERYNLANTVNADRFLSVHINSADSASAKGTETLYKDYKTYAGVIHTSSLNGMGYTKGSSYDRSLVYRPGLAVLRGTKMMSALAEMGFISNSTESARIDARSQTIGSALYQAICNSFN